jgi:ABC-type polysaccharide/polyol phosphate export permease
MDLFAQKTNLLANVLFVQLGLLVVVFGRNFKAGWHSHTQQLAIGLTMASLSQLAVHGTLQHFATQVTIHSQDDYKRVVGVMNSLNNAGGIIFIVVLLWWIVCLWNDEPGSKGRDQEAETVE